MNNASKGLLKGAGIGALVGFFLPLLTGKVDAAVVAMIFLAIFGGIIGAAAGTAMDNEEERDRAWTAKEEEERLRREQEAEFQRRRALRKQEENKRYEVWLEEAISFFDDALFHAAAIDDSYSPDNFYSETFGNLLGRMDSTDDRYEKAWMQMRDDHIKDLKKSFLDVFSKDSILADGIDFEYDWLNTVMEFDEEEFSSRAIIDKPGVFKYDICANILSSIKFLENSESINNAAMKMKDLAHYISNIPMLYMSSFERAGYGEIELPTLAQDYAADFVEMAEERPFKEYVTNLTRAFSSFDEALDYINSGTDISDITKMTNLMWFYATRRPINIKLLNACTETYNGFSSRAGIPRAEAVFAHLYAKNLLGGRDFVKQSYRAIDEWVKFSQKYTPTIEYEVLASCLAEVEMYDAELHLLRKLISLGVQVSSEVQDRLNFLENGGTLDIKIYEVEESNEFLYDTSSVEWKPEAFHVFFRRLAMKKMITNYSMVISKWTKNIPLMSGQSVSVELMHRKFAELVGDFDNELAFKVVDGRAINLLNVGASDAALFTFDNENSKRCRCISVLFTCEKFGRNLSISMQTMFTPDKRFSLEELESYALAIKENTYVESFRETVAQVVDEVLNPTQSAYNSTQTTISKNSVFE